VEPFSLGAFMDRQIIYAGALPLDTDLLNAQRFTMVAFGKFIEMFVGTETLIDGFTCIPTVPASLVVQLTTGMICALENVDTEPFGSLPSDSTPLMKMGVLADTDMITITPPTTSGYAQNYLIQIGFSEVSDTPTLLPYYNAADPAHPFEGPADSGAEQDVRRVQLAVVNVKPGVAAPAGTQATPATDAGYVPAFVVTVAQGQTTITSVDIATHASAPFISPKLPQIAEKTQARTWNWCGNAGGTANAVTATITPTPASYGSGGLIVEGLAAHTNTSPTVTLNVNGLGAVNVVKYGATPLDVADIVAGGVFRVTFDGLNFQLINPATETAYLDVLQTAELTFAKDNGNVLLPTGVMGELMVDFDCTITGVYVLADQSGSAVVDIWKAPFASFPPTVSDSICASALPTLSTAAKYSDLIMTGWTKSITAGDVLRFNLDSVTSITRLTVILKVTRF
jgi:hypothetical protein